MATQTSGSDNLGMAAQVAAFDWSTTSLGPMPQWPQSLRTAVSICLNSRFPMFVWWGPQLINIHNDAYVPVLGERQSWALGKSGREIWTELWPAIGAEVDLVMQGEAVSHTRQRLMLERNGYAEETFFTYSHSPIADDAGGIGGLFQVCYDETAVVLAERALEQRVIEREKFLQELDAARRNLATIVAEAPAFIAVLRGPNHMFELVNDNYYKLIGRNDVAGQTVASVLPEVIEQRFIELLDNVYRTGKTHYGTETPAMLGPEGAQQQHYVNFVYQALRGSKGEVNGVFVHGVDVTHSVQARNAIKSTERQRRLALETAELGAWHIDLDTFTLSGDERFREIFGLDADNVTYESAVAAIHPDDRDAVRQLVSESMQPGNLRPYTTEHRVIHRDGSVRWVFVKGRPNVSGDASSAHTFDGTAVDFTERKNSEVERERLLQAERSARAEAELAGRMKDEFLATLSHEIRTPLNAILGWSHIMQQSRNSDDIKRGIEVIERNARAQSQIIEDLLDMSSIISGKVRLDVQRLNLADIVTDAVAAARPTAEAKNVRLDSIIDPMHGVEISGDANRVQQILWNLISNAIKFTAREGKVRVLLERVHSHLEISVIDSGEGIAPEFLPFVFDRFRQADSSTTRRHGGLGLGLSIVRQLVELHGGLVRVESAGIDRGSTFIVALPLMAVQAETEQTEPRQHPRISHSSAQLRDHWDDLDGVKVLIIDDEPDARALLQRLLEDCKADVTVAESTDEVLRLVQQQQFDVLVSDIGMPGEDGYSLIKRIRRLGPDKRGTIPAIALTAYARGEDRVKAVAAGFQMHIAKPVEPVELITMVASAAGRTQIRD